MKLNSLLLLTHATAAAIAGGVIGAALLSGKLLFVLLAVLLAAAAVYGATRWLGPRIRLGLRCVEKVVATGDGANLATVGIWELDQTAQHACEYAQRWAEAAIKNHEQLREIETLLTQLDRRFPKIADGRLGYASSQLRQVLSGISGKLDTDLDQILNCAQEISRCTLEIATGAEDQSDAVSKTTTYVEQISANIDSVSKNADAAQQAAAAVRDSSNQTLALVRDLIQGMDRIQAHVKASETKLRALGDHAQEIGSIVETISGISARTDLLALNASIESVRAGEHGRGFAIVAEEVRKLAEQAAQATREIAGLVEATQIESQESMAVMAEERAEVESEVRRVSAAVEALQRIGRVSSDSAARIGDISLAARHQLQLIQDVVLAVERISNVAKASRSRAEKACWTTKTLTKMTRQFDNTLSLLRGADNPRKLDIADEADDPAPRIEDQTAEPVDDLVHVG